MKQIILTSFASVAFDLVKKLLPSNLSSLQVAFIPTAADPYEHKDFVEADRAALVDCGMTVIDVDIAVTKGEDLEKVLSHVDIIFVAGGNVFYLLEKVRESGFKKIVKRCIDKGIIYIGSSAGSVLCCPTIDGALRFDDPAAAPQLKDHVGMDLVDFVIIPHAGKEKYKNRMELAIQEAKNLGYKVVPLSDNELVYVEGDKVVIY